MREAYLLAIALVASSLAIATEYNHLKLSEHGKVNFIQIDEEGEPNFYLELLFDIEVEKGDEISFGMNHDIGQFTLIEPEDYHYSKNEPMQLYVSFKEREHLLKYGLSFVSVGFDVYHLDSIDNIKLKNQVKKPLDMNLKKPGVEFEKDKGNSFSIFFDLEEGMAHNGNPVFFLIGGETRAYVTAYYGDEVIDLSEFVSSAFIDDKQAIKNLKKYGIESVRFNRKAYHFAEKEQQKIAELARKNL